VSKNTRSKDQNTKPKILIVYLEPPWHIVLRLILMIVIAPIAFKIFNAFTDGAIMYKGEEARRGTMAFFNGIFRNVIYLVLPLWLLTVGIRRKSNND
jgi:hypothetical protein